MHIFRQLAGIGALLFLFRAYGLWQRADFLGVAIAITVVFGFLAFIVRTNDSVEKDKIFDAAKRYGRGDISVDEFAKETMDILRS